MCSKLDVMYSFVCACVYQNYLKYYGYQDSVNSVALSDRFHDPMVDLSPAIRRFQRFAGLPVTGERDRCQQIFFK